MSPNPRVAPGSMPGTAARDAAPHDTTMRDTTMRAPRPANFNGLGVVAPPAGAPKVDAAEARALARHCMGFRDPIDARAWGELAASLALYALSAGALVATLAAGWWIGLLLAVPAGMAVVRIFTIQHDCGHGSYFSSRTLNTWVGRLLSVLTFTPYDAWKRAHTIHHAGSGHLDKRGIGDIDVLTLAEYRARTLWGRRLYRLYRFPLVIHVVGPPLYFLVMQRFASLQALPNETVRRSTMGLNVALVALYGPLVWAVGPLAGLAAIVATASVAAWVGSWLFYIQHQFEDTSYDHSDEWQAQVAALNGSSHYVLPRWVNWLTGNIALHHIHHLNARIPSYRLPECMAASPRLASLSRLTFAESLSCIGLALWDEGERRLVTFREARALPA